MWLWFPTVRPGVCLCVEVWAAREVKEKSKGHFVFNSQMRKKNDQKKDGKKRNKMKCNFEEIKIQAIWMRVL